MPRHQVRIAAIVVVSAISVGTHIQIAAIEASEEISDETDAMIVDHVPMVVLIRIMDSMLAVMEEMIAMVATGTILAITAADAHKAAAMHRLQGHVRLELHGQGTIPSAVGRE